MQRLEIEVKKGVKKKRIYKIIKTDVGIRRKKNNE